MAELPLDVIEQILVGLDVEDLIRCKSVCKVWQFLISSHRFVKAHLNQAYNNDRENHQLGHRRIVWGSITDVDNWLYMNDVHIVGSCNGLVCVSDLDVELVITNPSTREEKKLSIPPYHLHNHMDSVAMIREVVCWGFGYDSAADDYKVIVGFWKSYSKKMTLFYVLTLKSNIWKAIGEVNYRCLEGIDGVLCGGALHWFASVAKKKIIIISIDLSTEEFKEIPLPTTTDEEYQLDVAHRLGVIEECLCIYSSRSPLSTKKWVMKNNKWELYNDDHCETKYDVAHHLNLIAVSHVADSTSWFYSLDDATCVPCNGYYIRASIFVRSLVSPHPHHVSTSNDNYYEGQIRNAKQGHEHEVNKCVENSTKGNIRKKKRRRSKRYCRYKRPLAWI